MKIRNATKCATTVVVAGILLVGCNSGASQTGFAPTGAMQQPQSTVQRVSNAGVPKSVTGKSARSAPQYVLVDLGTFGGPTSAINANLGIYIGNCCGGAGL